MKVYLHMNRRITGILACIVLFFVVDVAEAQYSAEAVAHSKRATRRRTAVVVSSATHAKDEQAAAAQQSTTTTTTTEAAPAAEAAPATEPAPATTTQVAPATQTAPAAQPASPGAALPIGTVATALPGGCEATPVDNVQYYHCGADYYRVAYQGNNLVYVTTDPPK